MPDLHHISSHLEQGHFVAMRQPFEWFPTLAMYRGELSPACDQETDDHTGERDLSANIPHHTANLAE